MVSKKNSPGDILEVRGGKCHKKCHKSPVYFLNCSYILFTCVLVARIPA